MRAFFDELRKRKVIKVGIAYLIGAWVVLQLADVIFPALGVSERSITLVLGILVVGFPLALVLSWVFDFTREGIVRTDDAATSSVAGVSAADDAIDAKSIAVMPFSHLSDKPDQEYFCDGLTEELLNVLTRIPDLRVASRTSTFSFRGKEVDLNEVADKLKVAHILEGSVRKSGNRVRITAQLIEVATDSHLWSDTYDHEFDDIFAIQDDIAGCVLEALQVQLGGGATCEPTTADARAYEYFLRGRGYQVSGGDRDMELAAQMFQKAVEIDPTFVRAWNYLAEVCSIIAQFFSMDEKWCRLACDAGDKATELAPDRATSHMARGLARAADRQFADAEKDFLKTIELDPTLGKAYHHLARAEFQQGKRDKAVQHFAAATENSADDFESPLLATTLYRSMGDDDNARHYSQIGVERAERILEDYPDNQRAYYLGAGALSILGQAERAIEWAERALEISPSDPATRYNVACFYARHGDSERALDCLEDSVIARSWIENDPDLDPLRDQPRYREIIESLPG